MTATEHTTPRRLNLGCGFDHRPGYLNVDLQEFHRPDLIADVRDLSTLEDATFEEALALDVLEHLERKDVLPALREWHRVLIPGGSLEVRVPDLAGIGTLLAERDEVAFHHAMVQGSYGTQAYSGDYHLGGFSDLTLIDQLFEAGFDQVRTSRMHRWLLLATARRAADGPGDPIAIGLRDGIGEVEADRSGEWRWCDRQANVLLFARADHPLDLRLELDLVRPGEPTKLVVELGGHAEQRVAIGGASTITLTLTVEPGANLLRLISVGPAIEAPEDARTLHFELRGMRAFALSSADAKPRGVDARPPTPTAPAPIAEGLRGWIDRLPVEGDIRIVSTPVHFGALDSGEDQYAAQFGRDAALEERIGRGLGKILAGADRSAPALELGAGTGIFSRPLVVATDYPGYFITDTSPEFLQHTRESIDGLGLGKRAEYLVLSGDELNRWPAETLSLVALRSALHHVLDWERLIRAAARLLVPGGALTFEEPCQDGFVLQAALADVLRKSPAIAAAMSETVRRDLDLFVGMTLFYATTGIDKSAAEDKHVFPTVHLLDACRAAGLEPRLYPNHGYDSDPGSPPPPGYFGVQFRHNLAVNFGFGDHTLEYFDRHLAPVCEDLDVVDSRYGDPAVMAVVVATKQVPGEPPPAATPRRARAAWRRRR